MVSAAPSVTVVGRTQVPTSVSGQIRFLTAIAAIMVVYIHGTTVGYSELKWDAPYGRVQTYLSHNLFHVSLLIFFFSSGFLLFMGVEKFSDIHLKLRKRVHSLLGPYLLWSLIWLIILMVAQNLVNLDLGKHSNSGYSNILEKLFLDPVAGQLWFLRDLVFLTAFSPVFWLVPRLPSLVFLASAYVMWLWFPIPTVISARTEPWQVISTEALVWFWAGLLASRFFDFDRLDLTLREPRFSVLLTSGAGYLLLPLAELQGTVPNSVIFGLSVTMGFVFFISVYPWIKQFAHTPVMLRFSSFSLLIFVSHYPTLKIVILAVLSVLGRSPEAALAVYLVAPWIVIAGAVVTLSVLARLWPAGILALNGYRPIYPFLRDRPLK